MKQFMYVKIHNNYEFKLNEVYEGYRYKEGWLNINGQLYRENCFDEIR